MFHELKFFKYGYAYKKTWYYKNLVILLGFDPTGVDNVFDSRDGEGRLGQVGRQDDLSGIGLGGLEDLLLDRGLERSVKWHRNQLDVVGLGSTGARTSVVKFNHFRLVLIGFVIGRHDLSHILYH